MFLPTKTIGGRRAMQLGKPICNQPGSGIHPPLQGDNCA
jgi:hypothetical protein